MNSVWYGKKKKTFCRWNYLPKGNVRQKTSQEIGEGARGVGDFYSYKRCWNDQWEKKWLISVPFIFDLQDDEYRLSRFLTHRASVFPFPSFLSSFPFWNFISTIYHSHCLRWKDSHIGFQDATLPDSFFSHRVWQKWLFLTEHDFSFSAHLQMLHKSGTMRTLWKSNPDHWLFPTHLRFCQW